MNNKGEAEGFALVQGIRKSQKMGFKKIVNEGDSKVLIDIVAGRVMTHEHGMGLKPLTNSAYLMFKLRRSANTVANWLANIAVDMNNNGFFSLNSHLSEDSKWRKELKRCMDLKLIKIKTVTWQWKTGQL